MPRNVMGQNTSGYTVLLSGQFVQFLEGCMSIWRGVAIDTRYYRIFLSVQRSFRNFKLMHYCDTLFWTFRVKSLCQITNYLLEINLWISSWPTAKACTTYDFSCSLCKKSTIFAQSSWNLVKITTSWLGNIAWIWA